MKFNLIIYILLLGAKQFSFAQGGFSKNYYFNGETTALCLDAIEAPNGNIISTGIAFNGSFNTLKIMGTDAFGNKLWEKSYGNNKFEYLAELYENRTVVLDNNFFFVFRHVRDSNNKQLVVLIKFNFIGDTIWQKKYYENNKYLWIRSATKSKDGGFILTGIAGYNNPSYHGIIIIKTDYDGNELWRKFYSKPIAPYFIEPVKTIQDSVTKRIFLIGNQLRYDGHPNQGYSTYGSVFLFDSLGNFINSKWFGGNCGSLFTDGIQSKDNLFVAIGSNDQCNDLGSRRNKSFFVKFNHNLTQIQSKQYDTLSIYNCFSSIQEYSNGDLLMSGFYDTLHNYNQYSKYGLRLIKTDPNGIIKKRRYYSYDTAPANSKQSKSLRLLNNKGAIATYWLDQKPGGMPFSFTVVDSTLCDSTQAFCNSIGVGFNNQQYNSSEINIFPQPAQQLLNLNSSLFGNKKSQLTLNNILGQTVLNTSVQFTNGITQINLATLPNGIYLLILADEDNKTYTTKIIKE